MCKNTKPEGEKETLFIIKKQIPEKADLIGDFQL